MADLMKLQHKLPPKHYLNVPAGLTHAPSWAEVFEDDGFNYGSTFKGKAAHLRRMHAQVQQHYVDG